LIAASSAPLNGLVDICWLEQQEADVPAGENWLSQRESSILSTLRFPKRRTDWRLGRWTAKCAVAAHLAIAIDDRSLARIKILASASGAPEAFLDNEPAPLTISLSHGGGTAVCAIAPVGAALGCDLEVVEPRTAAFTSDYFTPAEQQHIAQVAPSDRNLLTNLLWSAKESALKALREGLRVDTRLLQVTCRPEGQRELWRPLMVEYMDRQVLRGWWSSDGKLVRTLVADPAPAEPSVLTATRLGPVLAAR
jgi:4'-phosphopantetheinyl transferase